MPQQNTQNPKQARQNGQKQRQRPQDELHLQHEAITPQVATDELTESNFGLGNYTDAEMWQQIQAYENHLYGSAAFRRTLWQRAVRETIVGLGKEEWERLPSRDELDAANVDFSEFGPDVNSLDDIEVREDYDRRRFIMREGRDKWNSIFDDTDLDAETRRDKVKDRMRQYAGVDSHWITPHMKLMQMRHEASRSRDARLMDNLFRRVSKKIVEGASESSGGLLGGSQ